jgi:hypothetical protein
VKHERHGFHLGWCGRRRCNGDDAQRGGAARCGDKLRRATAGGVKHGDDHKQCRDGSHLLVRLLGSFSAMKRRRSRGFDGGGGKLELGFRWLAARAKGGAGCSGRTSGGRRRP